MSQVFTIIPSLVTILLFAGLLVFVAFVVWRSVWLKKMKPTQILFSKLAIILLIFTVFVVGSYMTNITVDEKNITISVPFSLTYKVIEKSDVAKLSIIDWNVDEDFEPSIREFGVGFADYKVGSFKLNNGESALLLSSRSENLVIETFDGDIILVSPQDFDDFTTFIEEEFFQKLND